MTYRKDDTLLFRFIDVDPNLSKDLLEPVFNRAANIPRNPKALQSFSDLSSIRLCNFYGMMIAGTVDWHEDIGWPPYVHMVPIINDGYRLHIDGIKDPVILECGKPFLFNTHVPHALSHEVSGFGDTLYNAEINRTDCPLFLALSFDADTPLPVTPSEGVLFAEQLLTKSKEPFEAWGSEKPVCLEKFFGTLEGS